MQRPANQRKMKKKSFKEYSDCERNLIKLPFVRII